MPIRLVTNMNSIYDFLLAVPFGIDLETGRGAILLSDGDVQHIL